MLEALELNYWAILVAGVASYVLSFIWFVVFAKPWKKLAGFGDLSDKEMKEQSNPWSYVGSFLVALIVSYAMARLAGYAGAETWTDALLMGLFAWIGFVAVTTAKAFFWEDKSWKLWAINNGDHFVGLLVTALIVTLWV